MYIKTINLKRGYEFEKCQNEGYIENFGGKKRKRREKSYSHIIISEN